MQESEKHQATVDVDLDHIDQNELSQEKRNPWNTVIWVVIALLIIAFACFGVYTLLHIPPSQESTSMIQQTITFMQ